MATHYDTLGIPRETTVERIKRSYRRLVKIYHPDRCPGGSKAHAEAEKKIRISLQPQQFRGIGQTELGLYAAVCHFTADFWPMFMTT